MTNDSFDPDQHPHGASIFQPEIWRGQNAAAAEKEHGFSYLEALPLDLRDLPHPAIPDFPAERASPPRPGLAPESALRLRPRRALSSAPASTSLSAQLSFAKKVVVAGREE